jgi:hypothetical protein
MSWANRKLPNPAEQRRRSTFAESLEDDGGPQPLGARNTFSRSHRIVRRLREQIFQELTQELELDQLPDLDPAAVETSLSVFIEKHFYGLGRGIEDAAHKKAFGEVAKLRFVLAEHDSLELVQLLTKHEWSSSLALLSAVRDQLDGVRLASLSSSDSVALNASCKRSFKKHSHAGLDGLTLLDAVVAELASDLDAICDRASCVNLETCSPTF